MFLYVCLFFIFICVGFDFCVFYLRKVYLIDQKSFETRICLNGKV